MDPEGLEAIIDRRSSKAAPAEVSALADAVRERHGRGAIAILAYGSSLRGVDPAETLIDLYVLCEHPRHVSAVAIGRLACALVPPNVHYAEATFAGRRLRGKVAVLPLAAFERRCSAATSNPYFWARFAQPCRLIHARDEAVRGRVISALAAAARTMFAEASRLAPSSDPLAVWEAGFTETYRTELRPEGRDQARRLVAADDDYYRAVTAALRCGPAPLAARAGWRARRARGKALSVLRLAKAAFTFDGGAEYLAWKIERHSGARIELKPWQRRHPLLGALWVLPGLLRRGAVR